MITLTKKALYKKIDNIKFDFRDYLCYINDDETSNNWYGCSIQQVEINEYDASIKHLSLDELTILHRQPPNTSILVDKFVSLITDSAIEFAGTDSWLVMHDDNRMQWIRNTQEKTDLLNYFIEHQIDEEFRGCLHLDLDQLQLLLPSLVGHPYLEKTKNINLIAEKGDFCFRLTHHFSVEFITSSKDRFEDYLSYLSLHHPSLSIGIYK